MPDQQSSVHITPESAHEPAVVRKPPVARPRPVERSMVADKTKLTAKMVLKYVIEALLIVIVPFGVTAAFGLWQMARPEQLKTPDTPKQYRLAFETVSLKTSDGIELSAWDVQPSAPTDKAIVILSGYASDKGSILPRTAFLGSTYRLLYLDFRSFGSSSGKYSTLGAKEVADGLAAVQYLRQQGVAHIGIYGFTMGGAVALMTAAKDSGVEVVVTEDAYSDFELVAGQPYAYLGPVRPVYAWFATRVLKLATGIDAAAVSPKSVVQSLRIPALVIHSRADESVPVAHADALRVALKDDPAAEYWYNDGKGDLAARTEFAQRVMAFFNAHLGGGSAGTVPAPDQHMIPSTPEPAAPQDGTAPPAVP